MKITTTIGQRAEITAETWEEAKMALRALSNYADKKAMVNPDAPDETYPDPELEEMQTKIIHLARAMVRYEDAKGIFA